MLAGGSPPEGGLCTVLQPVVLGRSDMCECPVQKTLALGLPNGEGSVSAPLLTVGDYGSHLDGRAISLYA